MSILIFGGTGQIGHALIRELSQSSDVVAPARAEVDLTSADALRGAVERFAPSVVINASGYTAVDAAESDEATCAAVNADAPGILAEVCRRRGVCLVHFSTDYVFDGTKGAPYVESDVPRPLSVYGRTKLEGERAIEAIGGAYLIFRTSWVYAARGRNFALTMLRLAKERSELCVVDDQTGAPTSAGAIAAGVAEVLGALTTGRSPLSSRALRRWRSSGQAPREISTEALRDSVQSAAGVYHLTGSGATTWYGFARAILADTPEQQKLRAITTDEYPTAATRPRYSVLDNTKVRERFGVQLPSWVDQWQSVAAELRVTTR
ncbi:MAG TPA: dTDP-4-dehydrorhamnose reductase [Gemmatimonadaceae bacterium]|jgi:dTDP-4-dehydrorhamnose reductase